MVFNVEKLIQTLLNDSSDVVILCGIILGIVLWQINCNWELIKRPYDGLVKWYEYRKQKEELLQMVLEDHKRSIENGNQIIVFQETQNKYHEESIRIRDALAENISEIVKGNKQRDEQIDALIAANRVLLGQEINNKYKQYINLGGIPEDEVDEFNSLFHSYKQTGGNHNGDAKYKYVTEHLPVIPVETKLIIDN